MRWKDINGAVDIIEFRLQRNPFSNSRHIAEDLWRIDLPPVAAYFSVTGSHVAIESVRWIGP